MRAAHRGATAIAAAAAAMLCVLVAGWGARDALVAKRCLDGQLHPEVFHGATITNDACVIATDSGPAVEVALNGPSFSVTLGSACAAAFFAVVAVGVLHRARRR